MTEDIKGLIEKIQEEGVRAAEDKAAEIEAGARRTAQEILEKAQSDAQVILAQAKAGAERAEAATRALLKQAGRDLLLNLEKEIEAMLNKIIISEAQGALTPEEIIKIITHLVRDCAKKDKEDIIISLKKGDFEKLDKGFLARLKDEVKRGIILKPSEDISGGFIISFDAGKSHFDFTDKAMAEYIGLYLKPQLRQILEG